MPICFTIDHAKRFVHARAEGEIDLADIEEFSDAVMVENAMPYRKLFDGRGAFGKYDDHGMMMLGARVSAYAAVEKRRRARPRAVARSISRWQPLHQSRQIGPARPACSSTRTKRCSGSRRSPKRRD